MNEMRVRRPLEVRLEQLERRASGLRLKQVGRRVGLTVPGLRFKQAVGGCAVFLLALAMTACGGAKSVVNTGGNGVTVASASPTVLVVLENQQYSAMIGSPNMPYLNGLANKFAVADNYFADSHPSIGNYFMLTTGQILTMDDAFTGTVSADNLVREVVAAKKTWRVYAEGLPSAGYTGPDVYPYVRDHNPFAYFSDVNTDAAQAANMVPLTQLPSDLGGASLPDLMYVLANNQHDMHDCPLGMTTCTDADKMTAADNWLAANIDPIFNSTAFKNNGLLIITVDESVDTDVANGGGHVLTVVAGPAAKSGLRSNTFFQHQSTLRLLCDRLKLGNCPGLGALVPSLGALAQ